MVKVVPNDVWKRVIVMTSGRIYLSSYPSLVGEFDKTKNFPLEPHEVSHKSNKKVWWEGKECGHSWQAVVASRVGGNGCPICSNQVVLSGYNDLLTKFPEVAAEWDYQKNDKKPEETFPQSNKKVYWKCSPFRHSWQAPPAQRVRGRGCPTCAGKVVLEGFNDVASKYPNLLKEWDYENNSVLPNQITFGSGKRVGWVCSQFPHHRWRTMVPNRVRGTGCPICSKRNSKIEKQLAQLIPDSTHGASVEGYSGRSWTVDILLEAKKVVVEYDGWFYHREQLERDTRKTRDLIGAGYRVVRIREISTEELEFLQPMEGLHQIQHHITKDSIHDTALAVQEVINILQPILQ